MKNYVENKVIIITGAGSEKGFGRATAEKLAALGAKLVLSDISDEWLDTAIESIKSKGGQACGLIGDVSKYEDNVALVKLAVETYGKLDVFIANAGIMPLGNWSAHEEALSKWDKGIDINLKGVMYAISASYDQMISQKDGGHFIAVSSIFANFPVAGAGVYQATKIGVKYLVGTLRQEAKGKIKTTIINPTGINSTNLQNTVASGDLTNGILGWNEEEFSELMSAYYCDELDPEYTDLDDIRCWQLNAGVLADNIVYAINQPLGVTIGEVTVRSSNEMYIL